MSRVPLVRQSERLGTCGSWTAYAVDMTWELLGGDPHIQPAFGELPLPQGLGWGDSGLSEEAVWEWRGAFLRGGEVGIVQHRVGQGGGMPCRDGGSRSGVDGVMRWLLPCGLGEAGCEESLLHESARVRDACVCFLPVSGVWGKGLRCCQIALGL